MRNYQEFLGNYKEFLRNRNTSVKCCRICTLHSLHTPLGVIMSRFRETSGLREGRRHSDLGYFTGIPRVPFSVTVTVPTYTSTLTGAGSTCTRTYTVWPKNRGTTGTRGLISLKCVQWYYYLKRVLKPLSSEDTTTSKGCWNLYDDATELNYTSTSVSTCFLVLPFTAANKSNQSKSSWRLHEPKHK